METTEQRVQLCPNLEVREHANIKTISGYAAVFNTLSDDLGGFREKIAPGAFKRSLKENADVRALIDHSPTKILGRSRAGTLEMREDKVGLRVDIHPPDTQVGRDIIESIRRGDVDQMSFGFQTINDAWITVEGEQVRELRDVDLFDVSVVTFPAYPDTSAAVRSLGQWRLESNKATLEKRREILEKHCPAPTPKSGV